MSSNRSKVEEKKEEKKEESSLSIGKKILDMFNLGSYAAKS